MIRELVLFEKNSVVKTFISALNINITLKLNASSSSIYIGEANHINYILLSSGGHMFKSMVPHFDDIKYDEIPYLPNILEYELIPDKSPVFKKLLILTKQNSITNVIHYGDCGQEGQIIQDIILTKLKKNKVFSSNVNYKRAWYSEVTESAMLDTYNNGLKNLKDKTFQNLSSAGYTRQLLDWWYGINLSSLSNAKLKFIPNCKKGNSMGRVKTPITYAVYKRWLDYTNHKKVPFWFLTGNTKIAGVELKFRSKKIDEDFIFEKITLNDNSINHKIEQKTKYSNKLFNLTALQFAVKNKFNLKQSLDVIQKLYETGFITYPRTEEEKLSPNIDVADIKTIYNCFSSKTNLFFFNKKLALLDIKGDEMPDHTAIIPTVNSTNGYNKLSSDNKFVFDIVTNRFLAVFSHPAKLKILKMNTLVNHNNIDYQLNSSITLITDKGYLALSQFENKKDNEKDNEKDNDSVIVTESIFNTIYKTSKSDFVVKKNIDYTKPSPLFNEATLLRFCEKDCKKLKDTDKELPNGIGTSATRTTIINKIITDEYIENSKDKKLIPTAKGIYYCESLEKFDIPNFIIPKETALMEYFLNLIRKGEVSKDEYLNKITTNVKKHCENIKKFPTENFFSKKITLNDLTCPYCKKSGFDISGIFAKCNSCEFKMYIITFQYNITEHLKDLFENKTIKKLKLFSKKNNKFFYGDISFSHKDKQVQLAKLKIPYYFAGVDISEYHTKLLDGESINMEFYSAKKKKKYNSNIKFNTTTNKIEFEFEKK